MRKAVDSLKKQMTVKRTCKHGAGWKKARKNSGKEVVSEREKQKMKRANQASLLSMESSHNSKAKEIVEVEGQMGGSQSHHGQSGAAGHPTSPKECVAANGEQIRDLGE